ncbi:reverse transcriptase domain-containing protein [Tanacetum coccineum]
MIEGTKKQQTYKMIIGSIDVNAARYVLVLPMTVNNTASLIFEELVTEMIVYCIFEVEVEVLGFIFLIVRNGGQFEYWKARLVVVGSTISFVQEEGVSSKVLPCQLPPKELNPGNFTLPYTIGSLKFYAMVDLGASINVIPKSMFEHLKLARLKKTNMLVEMADMTKRAPIGIVENVLVKIDKFLFPLDFVVIDMLNTHNETMILGRPFIATILVVMLCQISL